MDFFNFGDEEIKRELEKKIEKQKDKVLNLFETRGNEGIKYKNKSYKPNLKIDPSRDSNFEYFKDKTTNILRNENPYYLEEFLDKIYKGVNIYSLIDLYFDLSGNSNESILFLKKMEYGKGGEEKQKSILDLIEYAKTEIKFNPKNSPIVANEIYDYLETIYKNKEFNNDKIFDQLEKLNQFIIDQKNYFGFLNIYSHKFKIGSIYYYRFIGDHNLKDFWRIIERKPKSLILNKCNIDGKLQSEKITKKIEYYSGNEILYPLGKYSMSPILSSNRQLVLFDFMEYFRNIRNETEAQEEGNNDLIFDESESEENKDLILMDRVKETYLKLPTSSLSKIKSLLDGLEEC